MGRRAGLGGLSSCGCRAARAVARLSNSDSSSAGSGAPAAAAVAAAVGLAVASLSEGSRTQTMPAKPPRAEESSSVNLSMAMPSARQLCTTPSWSAARMCPPCSAESAKRNDDRSSPPHSQPLQPP